MTAGNHGALKGNCRQHRNVESSYFVVVVIVMAIVMNAETRCHQFLVDTNDARVTWAIANSRIREVCYFSFAFHEIQIPSFDPFRFSIRFQYEVWKPLQTITLDIYLVLLTRTLHNSRP